MAKKKKKQTTSKKAKNQQILAAETKKGIVIILVFLVAILSLLSLFDSAGSVGIYLDLGLGMLLGWGKWLFPLFLLAWGYILLNPDKYLLKPSNYLGLLFAVLSGSGFLQLLYNFDASNSAFTIDKGGGYIGHAINGPLQQSMGGLASFAVLLGIFLISILISFNISLDQLGNKINIFRLVWLKLKSFSFHRPNLEFEEDYDDYQDDDDMDAPTETEQADSTPDKADKKIKRQQKKSASSDSNADDFLKISKQKSKQIPHVEVPIDLLDKKRSDPSSGDIKANQAKIQSTFENFGIEVTMGEVNVGPTVTQFTLKPAEGVKLSHITNLQNDLALALAAHPIRIEAPIPGRSLVGIEVPNQKIATVKLREIIESQMFKNSDSKLTVSLGKNVSGDTQVADISKMPHCLIAGATGSGKSVCINNFIISLLYRNHPDQLKLIMVDPKRVELSVYDGIPHLLTPVITEVPKTINALRWAVNEMDERYKLLSSVKKRNIESYNKSVLVNQLPYIVIVIDELADLMSVAAKEVEAAIIRLAQMARAVGIHLVIATQRPSTNVITGLIKANITTRIAFSVASQIDSRTIIDSSGAEKLLGKGDMLYTSAELSQPRRLQGAFVSDTEIKNVIKFWKDQAEPEYQEEIIERQKNVNLPGSTRDVDPDEDELLPEAQEIILKAGKGSASLLQRRLRVGYARAARLLDLLQEKGIVGPAEGSKPREVLVSQEDLENNLDMREYDTDGWEDEDRLENDAQPEYNQDEDDDQVEDDDYMYDQEEDEDTLESYKEDEADK